MSMIVGATSSWGCVMTAERKPPRIITPLVLITTIVAVGFGIADFVLLPELKARWILGILFLPATITALYVLTRKEGRIARAVGRGGGVRAGLVGAGVAFATAFGFTFTDQMGWTGAEGQISSSPVWLVLFPAIAFFIELMNSRLEKAAKRDHGDDDA